MNLFYFDIVFIIIINTCNPSKKLSPMIITVEPPVVHPSLGEIAFITGIADVGYKPGYKAWKVNVF